MCNIDQLLESPDRFERRRWNDEDSIAFFLHDDVIVWKSESVHPDIWCDLLRSRRDAGPDNEERFVQLLKKEGLRWIGNLTYDLVGQWRDNYDDSPRRWATLAGRLWRPCFEFDAGLSFWEKRKDVIQHISKLIPFFRAVNFNYKKAEIETAPYVPDSEGNLDVNILTWDTLANEEGPSMSAQEIEKMMKIQHTAPMVKQVMGKKLAGSMKAANVASSSGFRMPAEQKFYQTIGDSQQ